MVGTLIASTYTMKIENSRNGNLQVDILSYIVLGSHRLGEICRDIYLKVFIPATFINARRGCTQGVYAQVCVFSI